MQIFVLTREQDEFHLTLGVFTSPEAAMDYMKVEGVACPEDWGDSRAGNTIWTLHHQQQTYTIEGHKLSNRNDVEQFARRRRETSDVRLRPMRGFGRYRQCAQEHLND